jgi:hypothetical protein
MMIYEEWRPAPKWHPRRWFGYDMRRWVYYFAFHLEADGWEYGKSQRIARDALRLAYEKHDE